MKKGPMLRHFDRSMVTNPRFQRFRLSWDTSLAFRFRNLSVPAAAPTAALSTPPTAVYPVIVIGVPVRYIHSHHGFASLTDYKNSVKLAVEIIKHLNDETIKSF